MKIISTNNRQIDYKNMTENSRVIFTSEFLDKPTLICKKTPFVVNTKKENGFFSKLGKKIRNVVNTVKEEIKSTLVSETQYTKNLIKTTTTTHVAAPITRTAVVTPMQPNELEILQKEFERVLQQYYTLLGFRADMQKYSGWKTLTLPALKTMVAEVKEEILREKMMQGLEIQFTKGARHYLPKREPFDCSDIQSLNVPDKSGNYKKELKELAITYLKNSARVDKSLLLFNELSHNFFSEAAQSIKDIYAIQSDPVNKWLERIPKLGIIPKALRVKEQVRLTRCILKDYGNVSESYVNIALKPYIKKYDNQLSLIKDYVAQHKVKAMFFKGYTNSIISTLEKARAKRMNAGKHLLDNYAANGANLSKMCYKIQKNGGIDLVKKTLFTLLPFC